ncbi:hypothetical protein [Rhizobium aegyptiacum]|uniref:hypothetical protein n=1 Tax=Rhizobium aegyptiacum TaxID=1764550 RepID=UPI001FD9C2C9|nr:hypothetical protein [Rhizobium aegyptiacum]
MTTGVRLIRRIEYAVEPLEKDRTEEASTYFAKNGRCFISWRLFLQMSLGITDARDRHPNRRLNCGRPFAWRETCTRFKRLPHLSTNLVASHNRRSQQVAEVTRSIASAMRVAKTKSKACFF